MNKKYLIIIAIIVLVLIGVLALAILRGDEDTWLCQNGQWVRHGNPSAPMPTSTCGTGTPTVSPTLSPSAQSEIEISVPQPNSLISSPLTIEGQARGFWYFEAVFPIRLLDSNGNVLAQMQAHAQSDWMTEDFVPFKADLTYTISATTSGTLLFNNDNPSGLPENSKEFRVPVIITPSTK